jgi:CubicO group peptidase (beta-lactamase class C family)
MVSLAAKQPTHGSAITNLFDPIGIKESVWRADPQGINHGWGDLQLHPRDMARIGQLFLNEGTWNGMRIVSKSWVDAATEYFITAEEDGTGDGYQWWILAGEPNHFDVRCISLSVIGTVVPVCN